MPERIAVASGWLWALIGAFGALGGVAKFLHEVSASRRAFSWLGLISYAVVSGFVGVLFGLIPYHYDLGIEVVLFVSGSAGGLGWACMSILEWFIRTKLREQFKETPPEEGNAR